MKQFTKTDIGNILKELRISADMTQEDAAKALGRKRQVISHWETGYTQPDAKTLFLLCDLYNADIGDAFGFPRRLEVSKHEISLIEAYRKSPEVLQVAIDRMLGIERKQASSTPMLMEVAEDHDVTPLHERNFDDLDFAQSVIDAQRETDKAHGSKGGKAAKSG